MSGNTKDFKVKNGIQPTVYHEAVGTVVSESPNYNIAQAVLENTSPNINAQETNPNDVAISSDGTKMYIVGNGSDSVLQYTMSTAFDVSTASYDSVSILVRPQCDNPLGLTFSTDGSNFYVTGITDDNVAQYSLSTPWSLASATYSGNSFDVSTQEDAPKAVIFSSDGFKMYVCGSGSDAIHQYNLTTAWDVSSASYSNNSLDTSPQDISPQGLALSGDGTKLFMAGSENDAIYQYNLSTANDLSTATYSNINFSVASLTANPNGVAFSNDGTNMYVVVSGTVDTVSQYSTALTTASLDLSSGSVFDYTPTSDVQITLTNPAASGTSSGATLLLGSEDAAGVSSTFSTTLYTGTGASQTITNNIDLATDGGLVWIKDRSGATNHSLVDSERGVDYWLRSNTTGAQISFSGNSLLPMSFNSNGFTTSNYAEQGYNGNDFVSWTFKKQTKFFDIVTYTGNGGNLTINHNLGSVPGCIIIKCTSAVKSWVVYHRGVNGGSNPENYALFLNTTDAQNDNLYFQDTAPTSTQFFLGDSAANENGQTHVAYLFAHDTDASSIIKCGSYTTDGNEEATIDLGWEPQWVLFKRTDSSIGGDWNLFDTVRGLTADTSGDGAKLLEPNTSDAELATSRIAVTPTGFKVDNYGASRDFIYMAIRSALVPTITYDPDLQWSGGTAPTAPATGETDVLTFNTTDGGTTYKAVVAIDGAV